MRRIKSLPEGGAESRQSVRGDQLLPTEHGKRGSPEDVDYLMSLLGSEKLSIGEVKMLDYALSLVETSGGIQRLKYYLFQGIPVQRNYAALYFKRRGYRAILREAYSRECIDREQAFSR